MPDRVFTEEEVKAIIRRAALRQEEEAERREARQHGLTLTDLEQLGAEVGLDPRHLRAAVDEVRAGRPVSVDAETRTDTHVIVERRLGVPFTPEAWEDTVRLLRQEFGMDMGTWYGLSGTGRVEQIGRAHEWVHVSGMGVETRISASEREGQTRLILSQRVGMASSKVEGWALALVAGLVLGPLGGITAGAALDSGTAFLFAFIAVTLLTTLAGAPLIARLDRSWREKRLQKLRALAVEIDEVFEAASSQAEAAAPETASPPPTESVATGSTSSARLDLDALPDETRDERRLADRDRARS